MEANEVHQTNLEAHNDLLHSSLTMLWDHVSTLPPLGSSPFIFPHEQPNNLTPPLPSLKLPKLQLTFFEGPEPPDWLFQVEQYFDFYPISPKKKDYLFFLFTWKEKILVGLSGCITIISLSINLPLHIR